MLNDPQEWIECMSYSPSNDKLGVGSHDNFIYIYPINAEGVYSRCYKLKGHSSYISAFDWSLDSSYIRSNCGAYELLFFNAKNG